MARVHSKPTPRSWGNAVEVRTRRPLGYHEGLTIAVAFDKGFVHEPTAFDKASLFLRSNWPLGLPVIVFVFMFISGGPAAATRVCVRSPHSTSRRISSRRAKPARSLIARPDMRDITSTIVDLAVRGYLLIEEHQKDRMLGLFHDKDYNFILKKDRAEWAKLKPHEQVLLSGIFSSGTVGETVSMSSLENRFYTNLRASRTPFSRRSSRMATIAGVRTAFARVHWHRRRCRYSFRLGRQRRCIFHGMAPLTLSSPGFSARS